MTNELIERTGAPGRGGVAVGLLAVLAALVLMMVLPRSPGGVLSDLITPAKMLALVLLASALLRRRGETWAGVGLRRPGSFWRVGAMVLFGYVSLALAAAALMGLVFPAMGIAPANPTAAFAFLKGDPWRYAYWLLLAWTSAAIGEELLFRGFIQSRLEILLGGTRRAMFGALLLQAAAFGVSHGYQGLGGVLLTAAAGLILGAVRLAGRGNLVACMLLHALVDTISLTALFLGVRPGGGP